MPTKEYGYRNGQLLVTAANGDEQRLTNFVAQLYYRAGGYSSANVQTQVNALANAGAQGELPLREAAKTVVRQIYQASSLPAADFVAALYLGALQRYGDPGGLSYWTSIAQNDRNGVIEAFVGSGEFNERAQVLYGREVNEYDRTDKFTHYLYNVIEGRGATATERDARRAATDGASVSGQAAVVTNAKDFARSLFNGAEYAARNRSNSEFVSDLYYAFLRYAPDAGGWSYWTGEVGNQGRTAILEAFLNAGPFDVSAGALYREVLWLVPDHLGTPRMIAERSGQPAGIKHHDYLPFGEELFSGISGRDASHGYGAADSVRQQFTSQERDKETGLDFMQARYYSSAMGRFTSVDSMAGSTLNPQTLNLYGYVQNNPLVFTDPTGHTSEYVWDDTGNDKKPRRNPAKFHYLGQDGPLPTTTATKPPLPKGYIWDAGGAIQRTGGGAVIRESVTVSAARQGIFRRVIGKIGSGLGRGFSKVFGGVVGQAGGIFLGEMINPSQTVGGGDADIGDSLDEDTGNTFLDNTYNPHRLKHPTVYYRVFGETSGMYGKYFTETAYTSAAQARRELALVASWGNTAENI